MELQHALSQIGAIRMQMSRTRIYRGYGALTTFCTGLAALAAGVWQTRSIADAAAEPMAFVRLWVMVAAVCAAVMTVEMVRRYRQSDSLLQRELTLRAAEQFTPCLIAGGLATWVLCDHTVAALWVLPGLWQIFFGLGFFASRRLLPTSILLVGSFYVGCGLFNLSHGASSFCFSAWATALPFAIGQTAAAFILRWGLEPRHAS